MIEKTTRPFLPHRSFAGGFRRAATGGAALFGMAAIVFCLSLAWPGAGLAGEKTRPFDYRWGVSIKIPKMDNPMLADKVNDWLSTVLYDMIPDDVNIAQSIDANGGSWSITGSPLVEQTIPGHVSVLYEFTVARTSKSGSEKETKKILRVATINEKTGERLTLDDMFGDSSKAFEIICEAAYDSIPAYKYNDGPPLPEIHTINAFCPIKGHLLVYFSPGEFPVELEHDIKLDIPLKDLAPARPRVKGWK